MKIQGAWIILHRNIVVPQYQTGWKWTRTAKPTQCNKKFSKKGCARLQNHNFWSPATTFQWCFYGGNYIGIFWGSTIELARPDGALTFTRLCKASTGYYHGMRSFHGSFGCWEPQLSKKYRVDRGYYNISGSTIFKLFKSRWLPGSTAAGRIP